MKPTEQANIDNFVQSVREFCLWVESAPANPRTEMATGMRLLAKLHLYALLLPQMDGGDNIEGDELSDEQLKQITARLGFLPVRGYSVVFDPLQFPSEEPVIGDMADDLGDIYRDLKRGLSLYDASHKKEAVWDWWFNFKIHWGRHLASAQYALHCQAEKDDSWVGL